MPPGAQAAGRARVQRGGEAEDDATRVPHGRVRGVHGQEGIQRSRHPRQGADRFIQVEASGNPPRIRQQSAGRPDAVRRRSRPREALERQGGHVRLQVLGRERMLRFRVHR